MVFIYTHGGGTSFPLSIILVPWTDLRVDRQPQRHASATGAAAILCSMVAIPPSCPPDRLSTIVEGAPNYLLSGGGSSYVITTCTWWGFLTEHIVAS